MVIVTTREVRAVATRIRSRFRSRVLEWEHTIIMNLFGLIVMMNPSIFDGPGFVAFIGGPYVWGTAILIVGTFRLIALCVNGYMARPTAVVRALSAGSGILLFAAISLGFLFSWRWSTALAVYPVLGFFGLFAVTWSIFDVALPDKHNDDTT